MSRPIQHIQVHFDVDGEDAEVDLSRLESLVRAICEHFKVEQAEVNISIVNDTGIIDVHRQFLKKDTTTDVISFDLTDEFETGRVFQLVVNVEMAQRQAQQRGHSTEAELALYITHGMLHCLGYDDGVNKQATAMHEKEDVLLQANGYGIVYYKNKTEN